MASRENSNREYLRKILGDHYALELADLDAAAGVCAEILLVLRTSVDEIERRLFERVALRSDTYETEQAAKKRKITQTTTTK